MKFASTIAAACFVAALGNPAIAAKAPTESTPMIEPWGYPLDALDKETKPGDDFYRYANGGWLDATEIPVDRSGVGFSTDMRDRNEDRIAEIIADLAKSNVKRDTDAQRIRDLYRSYMDQSRIEKLGLKPIAADLARIAAATTYDDIAALMGDPTLGLDGPFDAAVWNDSKQPDRYITWIGHSGLSMPDKSYYERDDEKMIETRAAYQTHVAAMLTLAGIEGGTAKAQSVFDLEKEIAALHWARADRRDADATYNPMDRAGLAELAPEFPWAAYFSASGLAEAEDVVVQELSAFPGLAALFAQTPVETWRAYLSYQLISSFSSYLPQAIDDEKFGFYGATLSGQTEQRARDKRGIGLVNGQLDQAVGKIYIDRYFPEESKRQMVELFENIRAALRTRIENLAWMTPETKAASLVKLEKMTAKIAYPDKWRDFSGVTIRADDLVGNVKRLRAFESAYSASLLGKPVDKAIWFTGPQTVNAFYSGSRNEAFIPAGYIQSPLFDPSADPALNYGAIGSIIGHEIGHGFDDQGSKFDGDGVLSEWWTEQDRTAFNALGDRFAEQFDQYEPLPGVFVNGRLTLGENIGDLAGIVVGYHAYLLSLDGKDAPVLDGFTGPQRVFLGRAQARRYKMTEEALRQRLLSAPHSPMDLRVNGMVRNIDEWYDAFDVKPGDALYLAPEDRVQIW